ncbi:MAG: RNA polymerase sigma factor [Oscillospiraceae bacterium]
MKEKSELIDQYIEEYSPNLSGLCCSLCSNYADADDLFQETWLKVIKNFGKYDSSKDFEKWLVSICINTYKNMVRSRKRLIQFDTSEQLDIFLSSIPDSDAENEEYKELIEIIGELPEKYKIILALRYFNDYSEKETAKILKIPAGTVKSRLNKAKILIRRRLSH